jgi:hypothetical protein
MIQQGYFRLSLKLAIAIQGEASMAAPAERPYLSAEEILIKRQLDPSWMPGQDEDLVMDETRMAAAYEDAVRRGVVDVPGVIPDPRFVASVNGTLDPRTAASLYGETLKPDASSGPSGGFPFAALAPIVGAIAPSLISTGLKFITGLFSKKKDKAEGSGVFAPNARGRFMASIAPRLLDDEEEIRNYRGKRFWREMLKLVHSYLVEALETSGIPESRARTVATATISHMLPPSFQRFVARTDAADSDPTSAQVDDEAPSAEAGDEDEEPSGRGEKPSESHLRSVIRPFPEWAIHEATDWKLPRKHVRDLVNERLMKYDRRYIPDGGSKEGIKDFWEKTKSISKAVGKELLPILTAASAAAASEVVRRVIRGIDVKSTSKPLMQMHRQLTEGSSEVIPDPIDSTEGSGLPDYDAPSPAGPLAIAPSQRARVGRIGGEYVRPPVGTPKGSPLWKQYMAHIRSMRGTSGSGKTRKAKKASSSRMPAVTIQL